MDSIIWLIVLVVLLLVEIITLGLTTIWFVGGALVAFISTYLKANIWVQLIGSQIFEQKEGKNKLRRTDRKSSQGNRASG